MLDNPLVYIYSFKHKNMGKEEGFLTKNVRYSNLH